MPARTRLALLAMLAGWLSTQRPVPVGAQAVDAFWQTVTNQSIPDTTRRTNIAGQFATVRLNRPALDDQFARAPKQDDPFSSRQSVVITLPLPDGRFGRFVIDDAPILVPELAAAFPAIKTYRGSGLDDPTATARLDWTVEGFHGQVIAADGTVYIDPYAQGDPGLYVSYRKGDLQPPPGGFNDIVDGDSDVVLRSLNQFPIVNGGTRRVYRLALAATGEYTAAAGGTSQALSRMVTTMNRVNGIYERDLAVSMTLATGTGANPTALIYTDPSTDPYTNADGFAMLGQNQANLTSVIDYANFDIGHVFSTGGGGVAGIGVPCSASSKARGVTGLPNPVGDAFDVDFVAHEMGHQFGANHTFNGTAGNCGGARSTSHAYEVGSGNTIMAYAGICSSETLQPNGNDYFHVESLNEITAFVTSGGGSTCGTATATGNTPPTVSAGASYTIPQQTPFTLTASGSDPNGDTVTYAWEQYNLGTFSSSGATASTDDGTRPLWRSYSPTTSRSRTFPSLTYILNNANAPPQTYGCAFGSCLTGETLPATNRTMTFQVTARDNRSGGGGIATSSTQVVSITSSGPFTVTAPDTAGTWTGGSFRPVMWNVANTSASPINVANVKISLSTDGGLTFPIVLLASTPNNGVASVFVPNTPTSAARIKVEAVGNIFFDISNVSFTILPGVGLVAGDFDGDSKSDVTTFRPSNGAWYVLQSTTNFSSFFFKIWGQPGDVPVPGDYDGDGRKDIVVYRPSNGAWYILQSSTNFTGFVYYIWGQPGDIPVPGDYDGDGKNDVAVYRPSNGAWYILQSSTNFTAFVYYIWGQSGDIPVPGDFDGDGKTDVVVYRPSNGAWYVLQSSSNFTAFVYYIWGQSSDIPVQGDFDGDGKADVVVYRPSNGAWYILTSSTNYAGFVFYLWGQAGDIPAPGDFDGDGKTDVVVYRPSNGAWYILQSSTNFTGFVYYIWGGQPGDIPVLKRP